MILWTASIYYFILSYRQTAVDSGLCTKFNQTCVENINRNFFINRQYSSVMIRLSGIIIVFLHFIIIDNNNNL